MQTANPIAVVLFPENGAAHTKIYGLSVLERTLHALDRAGVGTVFLPKKEEGQARAAAQQNKGWKLAVRPFPDSQKDFPATKDCVLLLSEPLVLDPKVPEMLLKKGESNPLALLHTSNKIACLPGAVFSETKSLPTNGQDISTWLDENDVAWEAIDSPGLICRTANSPAEKKAVKKALIRSLTKPTDGWVSRHLNRPVSTLISRVLAYTPITPNQFTIVTGLIGLATGVFAAMGGYWNFLVAGALFHLTSVLDGVDGELARLKFKSSPFGQWLDTLVDNLSYVVGLGGIIIGTFRAGATDLVKISALLAVVFVVLALGSMYLYLLRFKLGGTLLNVKYSFQEGTGWFDRAMRVAGAFGKRDLFALVFFVLAIFGHLPMALGYIAIMAFFVFAFSVQAHVKASKERKTA